MKIASLLRFLLWSVIGSATLGFGLPALCATPPPPQALTAINVTSASASVAVGKTVQLTATGTYAGAPAKDLTSSVIWTPTPAGVVRIDPSGLVTGLAVGTATVQASSGGITSAPFNLSVAPAVLVKIAVTPDHALIGTGQTTQFKATGTYSDSSTGDLAAVTWSSSAPGVASINSATGLATGVAAGQTTVQASSGGINSAVTLVDGPAEVPIKITPQVIQPVSGKLPSPVSLGVAVQDCNGVDLTAGIYTVQATGAGLSLSPPSVGKCLLTTNLTIDASASTGPSSVILLNNTHPVGSADLAIMDTGAGPIPPGLAPEVDVMWEVMAQNNCMDTFGKRVGHSMYCIQVTIGNNSGHPIQLAGIGFTKDIKQLEALGVKDVTIANSSYASTRAVLVHSQTLSTRNVIYNGLTAAGLLMAGFTPYFSGVHQKNAKIHYLTAIAIVTGPVLQAINLIWPDPIITQLKNLDDESLRDNMIIPNNSPTRTVVFVEKQAVTLALRDLQLHMASTVTQTQSEARTARKGVAVARSQNLSDAEKKEAEGEAKAAAQAAQEKATAWKAASAKTSATINNSTRPTFQKGDFDPQLVKIALGDLVIVGEEIEYLQRIQMQSGPATPPVSVTVTPDKQSLMLGDQQKFVATVIGNPNTNVTWSLLDSQGAKSTIGNLTADGAYTAPSTLPTPNTVNVRATSAADSSKFAAATVTIVPIALSVTPTPVALHAGDTQKFTANTPNIKWSVAATGGGKANGSIDAATGVYTAPKPLPAVGASDTVTATSSVDGTKTATATVTFN